MFGEWISKVWLSIDTDNDQSISVAEWRELFTKLLNALGSQMVRLFVIDMMWNAGVVPTVPQTIAGAAPEVARAQAATKRQPQDWNYVRTLCHSPGPAGSLIVGLSQCDDLFSNAVEAVPDAIAQPVPTDKQVYLLSTITPSADDKMGDKMMPPTADEFVSLLSSTNHPTEGPLLQDSNASHRCNLAQTQLLSWLIEGYNKAETATERLAVVMCFMVQAVRFEAAGIQLPDDQVLYTAPQYDVLRGQAAGSYYLLENYPAGQNAHARTLAASVHSWCSCIKLLESKVQTFNKETERTQTLEALLEIHAVATSPMALFAGLPDQASPVSPHGAGSPAMDDYEAVAEGEGSDSGNYDDDFDDDEEFVDANCPSRTASTLEVRCCLLCEHRLIYVCAGNRRCG